MPNHTVAFKRPRQKNSIRSDVLLGAGGGSGRLTPIPPREPNGGRVELAMSFCVPQP